MKPVVSSLVALAIAIAPLSAMAAKPHAKHPTVKVVKHKKVEKSAKADKADKADEKSAVVQVKHVEKKGHKPSRHHGHAPDMNEGHAEPKVDNGLVSVSMATGKGHHGKTALVKTAAATAPATKGSDMPKLPNPNLGKPSKGGAEKGAHKPTEKKSESDSKNDGQPARDEELAELVARIRGQRIASGKSSNNAKEAKPCTKEAVEVIRGPEVDRFRLTQCDGSVAPTALEHLSVLVRPGSAARPTASYEDLAKKQGSEISKGIRRVDPRLVLRLQSVVDHFAKEGSPRLTVISGYRPTSIGSMHATGRAIDFRLEGTKNEDVIAYCKTLTDTGCGFYPNSSFVHMDVRDPGIGHVNWIDASGPGETPRYVPTWPPPPAAASHEKVQALGESIGAAALEALPEPTDEHPALPAPSSSSKADDEH